AGEGDGPALRFQDAPAPPRPPRLVRAPRLSHRPIGREHALRPLPRAENPLPHPPPRPPRSPGADRAPGLTPKLLFLWSSPRKRDPCQRRNGVRASGTARAPVAGEL